MAGAVVDQQGRIAGHDGTVGGIAEIERGFLFFLDGQGVVLHLAVGHQPRVGHRDRQRGEAEPGERGHGGQTGRNVYGQDVGARRDRRARQHVFAEIAPKTVGVEIPPGRNDARRRRHDLHGGHLARHPCVQERHAVLVGEIGKIVAGGGGVGLAVRFRIDERAQADARHDDVPRAVVGQQGGIRLIRRVAEIQNHLLLPVVEDGNVAQSRRGFFLLRAAVQGDFFDPRADFERKRAIHEHVVGQREGLQDGQIAAVGRRQAAHDAERQLARRRLADGDGAEIPGGHEIVAGRLMAGVRIGRIPAIPRPQVFVERLDVVGAIAIRPLEDGRQRVGVRDGEFGHEPGIHQRAEVGRFLEVVRFAVAVGAAAPRRAGHDVVDDRRLDGEGHDRRARSAQEGDGIDVAGDGAGAEIPAGGIVVEFVRADGFHSGRIAEPLPVGRGRIDHRSRQQREGLHRRLGHRQRRPRRRQMPPPQGQRHRPDSPERPHRFHASALLFRKGRTAPQNPANDSPSPPTTRRPEDVPVNRFRMKFSLMRRAHQRSR